jgi:hypothetical protein
MGWDKSKDESYEVPPLVPEPPRLITEDEARQIQGKHFLVGIAYVDANEKPMRLIERHGVAVRANGKEGIVIRESDGTEFAAPPTIAWFEKAPAGAYTLRSTGEVVVDPDYVGTFIVNQSH